MPASLRRARRRASRQRAGGCHRPTRPSPRRAQALPLRRVRSGARRVARPTPARCHSPAPPARAREQSTRLRELAPAPADKTGCQRLPDGRPDRTARLLQRQAHRVQPREPRALKVAPAARSAPHPLSAAPPTARRAPRARRCEAPPTVPPTFSQDDAPGERGTATKAGQPTGHRPRTEPAASRSPNRRRPSTGRARSQRSQHPPRRARLPTAPTLPAVPRPRTASSAHPLKGAQPRPRAAVAPRHRRTRARAGLPGHAGQKPPARVHVRDLRRAAPSCRFPRGPRERRAIPRRSRLRPRPRQASPRHPHAPTANPGQPHPPTSVAGHASRESRRTAPSSPCRRQGRLGPVGKRAG